MDESAARQNQGEWRAQGVGAHYRQAREIARRNDAGRLYEDLRLAIQHYRSLFQTLLEGAAPGKEVANARPTPVTLAAVCRASFAHARRAPQALQGVRGGGRRPSSPSPEMALSAPTMPIAYDGSTVIGAFGPIRTRTERSSRFTGVPRHGLPVPAIQRSTEAAGVLARGYLGDTTLFA